MTTPPDLRERLIAALDADAMRPRGEKQGLVNVMLAVVEADLAARDAENARLRAEVQAQGEALLRCRTLLASAAGIVLAARTPTSLAGCTDCGGQTRVHPGHYPPCPARTSTS
ncbi:hypothetical protein ACFVFS_17485 [Kitasatospora sp. NPDC057692]|uniref:hypothetical protein n=1 Tax=Kitasatospora sp. NPDC057692 TaxID=3346215 RepID=UPI003694B675